MRPPLWARWGGVVLVVVALSACGSASNGTVGGEGQAAQGADGQHHHHGGTAAELAVRVTGGSVSGTAGTESVSVGEEVTLTVRSDEADEVHVHTYDLKAEVAPGRPATITFVADIPGVFEVELEGSGMLLFELEVR